MTYQKYIPSQRRVGRPENIERPEMEARIRRAIQEGMSDAQAGVYAGLSARAVWAYRKRHQIPPTTTRGIPAAKRHEYPNERSTR